MREAMLGSPSLVAAPTMKERESGPALPASCKDKMFKPAAALPDSSLYST